MKAQLRDFVRNSPAILRLASTVRGHRLHGAEVSIPHREVKKGDGNWAIPIELISPEAVIYSFGLGYDIDFELRLIGLGAKVHAFDLAPRTIRWMGELELPEAFRFHPYGLSATGDPLTFRDEQDASLTSNLAGYEGPVLSLETKRLADIRRTLGHERVDVLKMDIEGAEYGVLDDMIATGELPTVLMVEFHHKMWNVTPDDTRRAVQKLRSVGYRIYWVSDYGREYGLVRQ